MSGTQTRTCPLPECPPLSEAEIDEIAEKAAEKAIEKLTNQVYQGVGRSVVEKFIWIVGALVVGAYIWAQSKGFIK